MANQKAARPGRQLTMEWVREKIKEVALYHSSVHAWVIRPEALEALKGVVWLLADLLLKILGCSAAAMCTRHSLPLAMRL